MMGFAELTGRGPSRLRHFGIAVSAVVDRMQQFDSSMYTLSDILEVEP